MSTASTPVIVEVCPRDGLQNEKTILAAQVRAGLIESVAAAGAIRIEAVSFVDPVRVPQMANPEEVLDLVDPDLPAALAGLVLNQRGLDRALNTRVAEVNYVIVASDSLSLANQGCSTDEAIRRWSGIVETARSEKRHVTLTIAAAFGCPYEGAVPIERIESILKRVSPLPDEIAFADTIGCGVPVQVRSLVSATRREWGADIPVRFHFHDTRGTAVANAWAAVESGVQALDASVGGFGGCPFSPGASGNLATEDLCYLLHQSGVPAPLDVPDLIEVSRDLEVLLGRQALGRVRYAAAYAGHDIKEIA